MLLRMPSRNRPYHWGPYPLETLARDPRVVTRETERAMVPAPEFRMPPRSVLAEVVREYLDIFVQNALTKPAAAKAPVPEDPQRRAVDVKGYSYFMNVSQVGVCRMPTTAWADKTEPLAHDYAVVLLLEHGRIPELGNPARDWIEPAITDAADCRVGSIAVCLAGHICQLGWSAFPHVVGSGRVDPVRLSVLAGLTVRSGDTLVNPFIGPGFSLAVVTTDYALEPDPPLADSATNARDLRYWLGRNGAVSGREHNRRRRRATHLGDYPMETVKRVDRPTTLILDDEVPRVSKRAAFFDRALRGDLGEKAQQERHRFAFKQPHTAGMMPSMRAMVPLQGGEPTEQGASLGAYSNPSANARALKSLSYLLGADVTGICEIPDYAWYSHDADGTSIDKSHRYAVVMLIDQEFDTMEGASGDDWISGTQSMRAYLRGAEIAGVMAEMLRRLGFSARAQTNVDSEVLHIPLMLLAGLGELSRIGELVLNPFVGPRLKTVVMTTDIPLEVDQPIDFGLQYFCSRCTKCARECPCDAISWGQKVMFNGYEMWKPDVERCTRYRLTNARGSACGRCMKTCPLNKVVTCEGSLLERVASWCGINARFLKPALVPLAVKIDDWLGNGARNPAKKWWFDLEVIDNVCVDPVKGVNQRELNLEHEVDPTKQKIAYYLASMMPVPNNLESQVVDRKAALAKACEIESPTSALERKADSGDIPLNYWPTPADPDGPRGLPDQPKVYGSAERK
ncbi:MAG TPA: Fe-S protein [Gammaproteobacteria bacterium]|nr:Fe-S protein [Gammaproteobacteria bacterium]HIO18256.1 Fe-S protein [Gammaproteobacteria bacterium]